MNTSKREQNRKSNTTKLNTKKFLIVISTIVGIYLLLMGIWYCTYAYLNISNPDSSLVLFTNNLFSLDSSNPNNLMDEDGANDSKSPQDSLLGYVPNKTFFAIYGVDKGEKLADVIIVACYDKTNNSISTISVPRDTAVTIPQDKRNELSKKGVSVPDHTIKINSVHSWAGKYGNDCLTSQLNDMLNIKIDYYFQVNIDAFIEIVDTLGGVEIDVPSRLYYKDPTQNLLINLQPGLQTLNGEQAQGFVRYRQYKLGDIDRIDMQKIFITALINQTLDKEVIMNNLGDFTKTFITNVSTDMSINDALKYTPYIKDLNMNSFTMETLPGVISTPFYHDEKATTELVNRLFYDVVPVDETTTENTSN